MNSFLKVVFFNLLFLTLLLAIIEFFAYKSASNTYCNLNDKLQNKNDKLSYNINLQTADDAFKQQISNQLRSPVGLNYKKKPILLFGCSYTYGLGLNENQTFGNKLSHLTHRPVYNRAFSGTGIQHMYKQLESKEFFDNKIPEPEYIIFGFSYFLHSDRLIRYTFQVFDDYFYLRYYPDKFDKYGDLIEHKPYLPKYLNGLYTIRKLEEIRAYNLHHNQKLLPKFEDFVFLMFHKSKEKALKIYPNTKFVIYCFDIFKYDTSGHKELLKKLQDDGFIIIKQSDISDIDLTNEKWFVSQNDSHPNEKYWNEITPKIAKILNL